MNNHIDIIISYAATISMVEIGLGSILHSFHIPFCGYWLALNQGAILIRASQKAKAYNSKRVSTLGINISVVVSILKSLSPAGKRLTPMLAISAQGLLFSLGVTIFGPNVVGYFVAMLLLSFWTILQPILIYSAIYGSLFDKIADVFQTKYVAILGLSYENIYLLFLLMCILKSLIALIVTFVAMLLSHAKEEKYLGFLLSVAKTTKPKNNNQRNKLLLLLKDLSSPLFICSLIMTFIFFYYATSDLSNTIWIMLRPLSSAIIVFAILRFFPQKIFAKWAHKSRLGQVLDRTITTMKNI